MLDLDAIKQRWLIYDDDDSDESVLHTAMACADDIPALIAEVERLQEREDLVSKVHFDKGSAPSVDEMHQALMLIGKNPLLHDVFNYFVSYARHVAKQDGQSCADALSKQATANALEEAAKIADAHMEKAEGIDTRVMHRNGTASAIAAKIRALKTNKGE